MKKVEKLIILILLLVSLISFTVFKLNAKDVLMVSVKNEKEETVLTFNINEDKYYELDGKVGKFHIEVKNGKCRAIDVDCPNQICVHTGWISASNPVPIICLPNGFVVMIDE